MAATTDWQTMRTTTASRESGGISDGLVRFAAQAHALEIPTEALAAARRALIDTIGVMLAGRHEKPVTILADALGSGSEAFSFAGRCWLRAEDAAWLDGLAGHVLDYDDVAQQGHPSVVMIPALLAEAQRTGASGLTLLRSYVIGYEAWAELNRREADPYHVGSWHPTSMLGILAATCALAALHGLDHATTSHALAIAASFASGVIANFGTHTKPLQVGRAAAGAVQALRLARSGMTGSAEAVGGAHGMLRGISPHGKVDTTSPAGLGNSEWRLLSEGLSIKRYPVCYASHRAIDGVLAVTARNRLEAAQVRGVTVSLGRSPAATLRYDRPRNGLEARFSLHHNVAAALMCGTVGFDQLSDAFVQRPDVATLYPLTNVEIVDEECPEQPGMAKFDRVVIETHDGRRLDSGPIRYPRGHARSPLDDSEVDAKFLDCARHGRATDPERLLAALHRIDEISDLRELSRW